MKFNFQLSIIFLLPLLTFAQTSKVEQANAARRGAPIGATTIMASAGSGPQFYLDGLAIDRKNYHINPESIKYMNVLKEDSGKINITMLEGVRFVNLKNYIGGLNFFPGKNVVYFLNDRVINNPEEFYVQEDDILEVVTDLTATLENTDLKIKVIQVVTRHKKPF